MTPAETSRLIDTAGGDTAFAQLLGIDVRPRYQQRVNNWKRRGMPPAVILEHFEAIQKLKVAVKPSRASA